MNRCIHFRIVMNYTYHLKSTFLLSENVNFVCEKITSLTLTISSCELHVYSHIMFALVCGELGCQCQIYRYTKRLRHSFSSSAPGSVNCILSYIFLRTLFSLCVSYFLVSSSISSNVGLRYGPHILWPQAD